VENQDLVTMTDIRSVDILHLWQSVYDELLVNSTIHDIDNALAYKYRFDLHGLFKHLNIPFEYYYPNTIVNGYSNSTDYTGDIYSIQIVEASFIERKKKEFNLYLKK